MSVKGNLEIIDIVSQYLLDLFKSKISVAENEHPESVAPPIQLSNHLLVDCEQLSTVLAKAYHRHGKDIVDINFVSLTN
jgi:hypothetical protein